MPNARYMSKILDHAQSQEVSILRSFLEPIGACGLQTRDDGRTREDRGDSELGSAKECETVAPYSRTHGILLKVYQRICPDHCANGKIVKEGCHVLLEQ